ncbi:MAG: hypothetical protein HY223_07770 [Thaumarchaeota archaeon]|nr:hypothetical protein [Nitrososphaerota archaeon]
MIPRTKNRKAISAVLTTMIILVASVVLATGIVLYGTSLFQTNANSESIITTGTQLWVDSSGNSGWAWGAFDVRNTGDKLLSVDQIQIRGQAVPYANWFADTNATQLTSSQFQSALIYTTMLRGVGSNDGELKNGTAAGFPIMGAVTCPYPSAAHMTMQLTSTSQPLCFDQQSGPVSLAPGAKAIIYFKVPQNLLTSVDASSTNSVAVYAGKVGSPVSVTAQSK